MNFIAYYFLTGMHIGDILECASVYAYTGDVMYVRTHMFIHMHVKHLGVIWLEYLPMFTFIHLAVYISIR